MGLGNQRDDQSQVFVMCADLPRSPGHVFYDRLQSVLIKGGFDRFVEKLCEPYYASGPGRKSIPPGRYFRMHLIGYFEGIDVVVLDEQGKRRIASYGQATGYIKQGWTTDKMLFDATETDWKDVIGNNKIDFPVTMVFYASVAGGDKDILRVVFEPWEIDTLPEVSH